MPPDYAITSSFFVEQGHLRAVQDAVKASNIRFVSNPSDLPYRQYVTVGADDGESMMVFQQALYKIQYPASVEVPRRPWWKRLLRIS